MNAGRWLLAACLAIGGVGAVIARQAAPDQPDLLASQLWRDVYHDPNLFSTAVDRVELHPWQYENGKWIAENLRQGIVHHELCFKKAHGVGGTFETARLSRWFGATRRDSRVVTTAPSWHGVEDLIWPNIRRLHEGSLLGKLKFGVLNRTRLEFGPDWFMVGRATDDDTKIEGYHSLTGVCLVFDEAKGIRPSVWASLTGALTSRETLIFNNSTPGFESGEFFKLWQRDASKDPSLRKVHIHGPRGLAEGIPGMEILEKKLRERYGSDSEEYRARWLGLFMRGRKSGLISAADVDLALSLPSSGLGFRHAGLDVARSDDGDRTVLGLCIGNDLVKVYRWRLRDTDRIENEILPALREFGALRLRVDAVGLGGAVVDGIRAKAAATLPDLSVEEYFEGGKASDPTLFANRHSEAVTTTARRLREGGVSLVGVDVDGVEIPIAAELLQFQRHPTDDHRWRVEKQPRDGRGKKPASPDHADCYVIATAPDVTDFGDEYATYLRGRLAEIEAEQKMRDEEDEEAA